MSSFLGRMREYPVVSIDRFDGPNLQSTCYFLSHNHADHTQGLDQQSFQYRLTSNAQYKLYCSIVTRDLLLLDDRYKPLRRNIVGVEVNQPLQVSIYDPDTGKVKEDVTVTLLKAEHCPGSVMFLFEGSDGNALYTGDFRLNKSDVTAMEHLHSGSRVKEIESLYIDTTFCVPQALFIPSRAQSNEAVIDIVQEWIAQSKSHVVYVSHKAALGYEDLFRALCQHFNMKVHVSACKYEQYRRVGDMAEYTTPDPGETQIHACRWTSDRDPESPLPCGHMPKGCLQVHMRRIQVSTMYFLQRVAFNMFAKRFSEKYFRVCYSFHSSYNEVRDMVLYLQPHRAVPNVIPIDENQDTIQKRLTGFVEMAKNCTLHSSPHVYKPLGQLKVRKRKRRHLKLSQKSCQSSDYMFGDLGESPVKVKRSCVNTQGMNNKEAQNSVEFPALHGPVVSDGEDAITASQGSRTNRAVQDGEQDYGSGVDQGASENDLYSSGEDVSFSMSQEDQDSLEHFTPVQQEAYGSCLGYCSDPEEEGFGEDVDGLLHSQNSLSQPEKIVNTNTDKVGDGTNCIENDMAPEQGSRQCSSANDLPSVTPEDDKLDHTERTSINNSKSNTPPGTSAAVQNHTAMTNSVSFGSSVEIMDGGESAAGKIDSARHRAMMEGVEALELLKMTPEEREAHMAKVKDQANADDSEEVIVLEEDGEDSISGDSDLEDEDDDDLDDLDSNETTDLCPDAAGAADQASSASTGSGKKAPQENCDDAKLQSRTAAGGSTNGHEKPAEEKVICSIDLTGMDEEDDVQPSTSQDVSRVFNYPLQDNIFTRMGLSAMQAQLYNSPLANDPEGEVEFCEKEVPCSDDECECGGKTKGGTHKYMVPRRKAPVVPLGLNIDWEQRSQAADDDSNLEPAQSRTRKWIENQVLFTQRRNFINSQTVPNSDIIVINSESESSEEEDEEPETGEANSREEPTRTQDRVQQADNVVEPVLRPSADRQNESVAGLTETSPRSSQPTVPPLVTQIKDSRKELIKRTVSPKQQASPASDQSATVDSCPTNLSVLAQPSEQSMKSAAVDTCQDSKVVNGSRSDLTDINDHICTPKVPSDSTGDKETGSS